MRELVLKIGTTGLSFEDGDKIIEIAVIELENHIQTGKIYYQLINPNINTPSTEALKDFPLFAEIAKDFLDFLGTDSILIGHNIMYDIKFINNELYALGYPKLDAENVIDTLEIFNAQYPNHRNTLYHLCKRFHIIEPIKTDTIRKSSLLQIAQIQVEIYKKLLQKKGIK